MLAWIMRKILKWKKHINWRRKNPHNETFPINNFNHDVVQASSTDSSSRSVTGGVTAYALPAGTTSAAIVLTGSMGSFPPDMTTNMSTAISATT